MISIGVKGGPGKSVTAIHFLTGYLGLKKEDREYMILEFDAHNRTLDNFNSEISGKVVGKNDTEIRDNLSDIEFDADEKNIIIDVGGSENTERFLEYIKSRKETFKNAIFIIPELNEPDHSADKTVELIRGVLDNPKIIVALNKYRGEKSKEEEFGFIYGMEQFDIPAKPFIKDKCISIVTIPECEVSLGLAKIKKQTLYGLSNIARMTAGFTTAQKKVLWSEDGETPCDKETYRTESRSLDASIQALETLKKAEGLFKAIDGLRK